MVEAVVNPELARWLTDNMTAGFTAEQLIGSMLTAGYEKPYATQLVHSAFAKKNILVPPTIQPTLETLSEVKQAQALLLNQQFAHDRVVTRLFSMTKPVVVLYGNVLSAEECDIMIAASRAKVAPSTVVDPETGAFVPDARRRSVGTFFDKAETPLVSAIEARAEALTGIALAHHEPIQILNYQVAGEYEPHFDFFDPAVAGSSSQLERGGQRVATMILYLNDVESGGATVFPELGLTVNPRKGGAIYFENTDPQGKILPMTLHGGAPVGAGEKWIATKWFRERTFV